MASKNKPKKSHTGRYRSGLEKKFAEALPKKMMEYEPFDVDYTTHRKYKPDFVYKDRILIEVKGFFREGDTQKYKAIRDCIEWRVEGMRLVFLLSDPNKKVRKGGKITMGQWCDKEGFAHFTLDTTDELVEYVINLYGT